MHDGRDVPLSELRSYSIDYDEIWYRGYILKIIFGFHRFSIGLLFTPHEIWAKLYQCTLKRGMLNN